MQGADIVHADAGSIHPWNADKHVQQVFWIDHKLQQAPHMEEERKKERKDSHADRQTDKKAGRQWDVIHGDGDER